MDKSKFIEYPDPVPVLKEGIIYYEDDDGNRHPFKVTPEYLNRLCTNMNRRFEKTGDMSPLVLGKHTDPKAPAHEQPETVGFAYNWRVIDFNGVKAAAPKFLYNKEDYDKCKKFQRRSSEVWLGKAEIDPISLLGATTPEQDLGLVYLNRHPDTKTIVTLSREDMPDIPNTIPEAQMGETGLMKLLEGLNAKIDQLSAKIDGGASQPATEQPGGGGEMSPEELDQLLASLQQEEGAGNEPEGEKPVEKAKDEDVEPVSKNDASYAGGNNTYTPETVKKLQRDLDDMKALLSRKDMEASLNELKAKGVDLDVKVELEDLMALPEAYRSRQLDRISKNYRSAPINDRINPAIKNSVVGSGKGKRVETDEDMNRCVKLARDKKINFEQAAAELGYTL